MIYDVYVQKMVESILNSFNSKMDNFVFIKHYNILGLSEQDVRNMMSGYPDVYLLYHDFKYNEIQNPYEPFLEWIREIYQKVFSSEMTTAEFIDNCGVYSLQKDVFISYIETGKCTRNDEVLVVEIKYEKMKFIRSMISIFSYITSKVNLLIVLHKMHLSNYSTMSFLLTMMRAKSINGFGILATYNEAFQISSYTSEIWEELKEYIENNNLLYDWATLDKQKDETSEDVFIPKTSAAKEYVLKLNNMLHTFALEQAEYYMDIIHQKIEFENLFIPLSEKQELFCLYAMLNNYMGTYNKALLLCESLKELYDDQKDHEINFLCNYISGVSFIYMSQNSSAYRCAEECMRIAKITNDAYTIFKAELLEHMIRYYGWTDMYAFNLRFEADPEFIKKLEYYKYDNVLAHMYVYGISKNKNKAEELPEIFETMYFTDEMKKGLEMINKLGNDNLKINAYMNTIDFYRGINNFKFIEKIYKECINIQNRNDDPIEVADLLNGIGYNCSIVEKYAQANEYYSEALKIFYEEAIPERMGETIYNMAFNCVQACDYAKGLEFTNIAINIIEELGFQGYRMCKNSKLYGMAALCNYFLGADYNCYMYLNKIERIIHHIINPTVDNEPAYEIWADDMYLYYFVSGVMSQKNNELDESLEFFNKAAEMIPWSDAFKCFSYPILSIETARLYRKRGEEDKAVKVLNECIDYCDKNGYFEKQKRLINELQNRHVGDNFKSNDFQLKGITVEQIYECTNDYAVDQQLKNRLNDINFLSRWQDRLDKEDSELDIMITGSMKTIQNNFSLDHIIYMKMDENKLKLIYDSESVKLGQNQIDRIEEFFTNNRSAFIVSRIEKYFLEYEIIIKIFGEDKVVTLVGIPIMDNEKIYSILIGIVYMHRNFYSNRKLLDENCLIIIKYVFGQFVDAVERLRSHTEIEMMNQKLQKIASTDLLTGLLNRQGFMNVIKSRKKSVINKDSNDINSNGINTMLYIDLDNFKYYNDTVGHEMGDLVLVLFANILIKSIEKDGYAVRYGGDEFILMLLGSDVNKGIKIAETIYKEISSGFIDEIESKLGKKISIIDEKKISCCIGISEFKGYDEDSIEKALNQADEALYYVKKRTKHNYKVWTPDLTK